MELVIIGAGPKAIAIAAKLKVLKHLGFSVPNLTIIESSHVGANWRGRTGYTNGDLTLGTSPHKDIGFPYRSHYKDYDWDKAINSMLLHYSWNSFLIQTSKYSDWVDQGQPAPRHKHWAKYLSWVAERVDDVVHFVHGTVDQLDIVKQRWQIRYVDQSKNQQLIEADGLLVSGPGQSTMPGAVELDDGILDGVTFWRDFYPKYAMGKIRNAANCYAQRFAIVGAGEQAAEMCRTLLQHAPYLSDVTVELYAPRGTVLSRGEGYRENAVYSDPVGRLWSHLNKKERKEVIAHTDHGVFSPALVKKLGVLEEIRIVPARVEKIKRISSDKVQLSYIQGKQHGKAEYDGVIVSLGGSLTNFLKKLLTPSALNYLQQSLSIPEFDTPFLENIMNEHLAIANLKPYLHLPSVAALNQGPGFGNLSCLGRLSDRILKNYIPRCELAPDALLTAYEADDAVY